MSDVMCNYEDEVRAREAAEARQIDRCEEQPMPTCWQPIETAPHGVDVLVFGRNGIDISDWGQFCIHNNPKYTHWMPLPPPPAT